MNQDLFLLVAMNYIVYPWLTLTLLMGCWSLAKAFAVWAWDVLEPMWDD